MNFYLVVLRCSIDDLPLLATIDEDEAVDFARSCHDLSGSNAAAVLNLDASEPANVSIWVFVNGKLTESRFVKEI